MYNKDLIKKLLIANPNLNNVEIAKLYNVNQSTSHSPEAMRKVIAKIRKKNNLPNIAGKHTGKVVQQNYNIPDESTVKVNLDKGTFESTLDSMFDPKNDIELAKLHQIDLTKYKISSYWSKLKPNGKFTSSVNCTLRKLGDTLSLDEVKEALKEVMSSKKITPTYITPLPIKNNKALIIWVSDEHVGASVKDELYENEWNKSEYFKRKSRIIDVVKEQGDIHGRFDKIMVCTLGDTMDGFNALTTRGGHTLAQNMTNKEAIKTYVDVNRYVWDEIIKLKMSDDYYIYNVENSNHGGMGFDAAANLALEMYLQTKYPDFKIHQLEKIFETFSYGVNDFILTHGKDDTHMKRNLPLFLNDKVENFVKEYIDECKFSEDRNQHLVKGDLHQFATQQGKFFTYTNIPSLFGASGWIMSNFGKGKAGFSYSVVPDNSSEFTFTPVWVA